MQSKKENMDETYYWKQLVKIFKITEKVTNHQDEKQLSATAQKILHILKQTYDDGYHRGNIKNLEVNLKERLN